jgi:hypothetical protein
MENSREAPHKAKNRSAIGPSNTNLRYLPKGM